MTKSTVHSCVYREFVTICYRSLFFYVYVGFAVASGGARFLKTLFDDYGLTALAPVACVGGDKANNPSAMFQNVDMFEIGVDVAENAHAEHIPSYTDECRY